MSIWTCWVDASRRQTANVDSSNSGTIRMHIRWPVNERSVSVSEWGKQINKTVKYTNSVGKIILITQRYMQHCCWVAPTDVNMPTNNFSLLTSLVHTCVASSYHLVVDRTILYFSKRHTGLGYELHWLNCDNILLHLNNLTKHIKLASFVVEAKFSIFYSEIHFSASWNWAKKRSLTCFYIKITCWIFNDDFPLRESIFQLLINMKTNFGRNQSFYVALKLCACQSCVLAHCEKSFEYLIKNLRFSCESVEQWLLKHIR